MGRIALSLAFTLAVLASPTVAYAQTAPTSQNISLTFSGIVTNTASNTIRIQQPDGTYVPYTGPVPEFPYQQDEAVSISFNATVPTKAFYDTVYQGQLAADGIYRIRVTTSGSGSGLGTIGGASAADVSGSIGYSPNYGEPAYTAMTVVYDYNKDSYYVEGNGSFIAGALFGPGYVFDGATGNLVSCQGTTCAPSQYDYNSFYLRDEGSALAARNVGIYDPVSGWNRAGLWDLVFSGTWNLPQFGGSSGGVTDVPEPASMLLFGGGAAAVVLRRRRRRKPAMAV
jgi:PEP-CTERM motif